MAPADAAGLNVDDEILAIDEFRVRADRLDARLDQYRAGDRVSVLVARRDQLLRIDGDVRHRAVARAGGWRSIRRPGTSVQIARAGCNRAGPSQQEPASLELANPAPSTDILDPMRFDPEYVSQVLTDNFEDAKTLFLSPLMADSLRPSRDARRPRHRRAVPMAHALRDALDAISLDAVKCAPYDGSCEDLFFYVDRLLVNGVRRRRGRPAPHRPQPQRHRHDDVPDAAAGMHLPH